MSSVDEGDYGRPSKAFFFIRILDSLKTAIVKILVNLIYLLLVITRYEWVGAAWQSTEINQPVIRLIIFGDLISWIWESFLEISTLKTLKCELYSLREHEELSASIIQTKQDSYCSYPIILNPLFCIIHYYICLLLPIFRWLNRVDVFLYCHRQ